MRYYPNDIFSVISIASNIKEDENSLYTISDFIEVYPIFADTVPMPVLNTFVALANSNLQESRWHGNWRYAMGLFIAHFLTLYIETCGTVANPALTTQKALSSGIVTNKSVGDVSVSYDMSNVLGDITGWGAYKTTKYGLQLLTMARLIPHTMYVQ